MTKYDQSYYGKFTSMKTISNLGDINLSKMTVFISSFHLIFGSVVYKLDKHKNDLFQFFGHLR